MEQDKQMRITVSFAKANEDLYVLLQSIHNKSDYVCNALRIALQQQSKIDEVIKEVLKEVQKKMTSGNSDSPNQKEVDDLLRSATDSFDF